jgi:hypothetical protein
MAVLFHSQRAQVTRNGDLLVTVERDALDIDQIWAMSATSSCSSSRRREDVVVELTEIGSLSTSGAIS